MSEANKSISRKCESCLCDIKKDEKFTSCSQCSKSYHQTCIELSANAQNWLCKTCFSLQLESPGAPSAKNSSRSSKASSTRAKLLDEQRRLLTEQEDLLNAEMEMKNQAALEESRIFNLMLEQQKRRAAEYVEAMEKRKQILAQKQKLLEESMSVVSVGSSSDVSSLRSNTNKQKRVVSWIENTAKDNPPVAETFNVNNVIRNEVSAKEVSTNQPISFEEPHVLSSTRHQKIKTE